MRVLRSVRRALGFALVAMLFGGCLSTDTTISLRQDGSGTVELVYLIDRQAWETGVFDESDAARPVPVSRRDFDRAVLQVEGLRLRSHRIVRDDDLVTVTARIAFADVDSLRAFLGADLLDVRLSESDGHWRQVIAAGRGDPRAQELARSLEGYEMRFLLTPPRPVVSGSAGAVAGAATASFAVSLSDIVTAADPILWEVRW